jgi:hypothetical protein
VERRTLVERGGVPSLVLDGAGKLVAAFQWFPVERPEAFDRVAVSFSEDDGRTWSPPEPITVEGLPADYRRPFDPTLTTLADGRYRLYFTSHAGGAQGGAPRPPHLPGIYSAVSADAIHYRFEPEPRFLVAGERVIDCAVAWLGEDCHLFAPVQESPGVAYHATSRDGLVFERLPDVEVDVRGSWLGCAVALDGALRFYGTGGGGWTATSTDGRTWRVDGDRRPAEAPRDAGADPGVARTRAGLYVMVATGASRARGRADESPAPPREGGRSLSQAVMAANDHSVYVLRGGMLYRYDATSLALLASTRVPEAGAEGAREDGGGERRPPPAERPTVPRVRRR